jgi:hypothetical protein
MTRWQSAVFVALAVGALELAGLEAARFFEVKAPEAGSTSAVAPALAVELLSVIGRDDTEGEATSWPNAPKLAVDDSGVIHSVYQRQWKRSSRRGSGDRWVYARSEDSGRTWQLEEHSGRQPTVAVDDQNTVYIAFVERTDEGDRLWLWARAQSEPQGVWAQRAIAQGPVRSLGQPALAVGPAALHLVWERHEEKDHRIEYARVPLLGALDSKAWRKSAITVETLAATPLGVYFPAIVVDAQGRVVVVWEMAASAIAHRIDGAVRFSSALDAEWTLTPGISSNVGDARHLTLGLEGEGRDRVRLAFVTRAKGFRSALYTTVFEAGRWKAPQRVIAEEPTGSYDPTQQTLLAFPATWGGLLIWGHTVPAACGTGPLYWRYTSASDENEDVQVHELLGAFASYPHVLERPQGTFHLLWTDRDVEELRAFIVRYARLRLIPRSGR